MWTDGWVGGCGWLVGQVSRWIDSKPCLISLSIKMGNVVFKGKNYKGLSLLFVCKTPTQRGPDLWMNRCYCNTKKKNKSESLREIENIQHTGKQISWHQPYLPFGQSLESKRSIDTTYVQNHITKLIKWHFPFSAKILFRSFSQVIVLALGMQSCWIIYGSNPRSHANFQVLCSAEGMQRSMHALSRMWSFLHIFFFTHNKKPWPRWRKNFIDSRWARIPPVGIELHLSHLSF